jgi:antigen flippase
MRRTMRATAALSASSLLTIAISVVSAKVRALILGPEGVGLTALLQSFMGVAQILAGLGIGAGMVKLLARPIAEADEQSIGALWRGASLVRIAAGTATVAATAAFVGPLTGLVVGDQSLRMSVMIVGFAVAFNLALDLEVSRLNAFHRVRALSILGVLTTTIGSAAALVTIVFLHRDGIALSILASTAATWALARLYRSRDVPKPSAPSTGRDVRLAMRRFVGFGVPFTASQMVGGGIQFVVPILALSTLGHVGLGYYQAAVGVAGTYLGFLLTSMTGDYYQRVATAATDESGLSQIVREQQQLITTVAFPMIFATLALSPYLLPLIYTRAFAPAAAVLQWMLVGDVVKFWSWTLSYVILARNRPRTFFAIELAGGAVYLSTTWVGLRFFGLVGLGMAWVATYSVYLVAVSLIARVDYGYRLGARNRTFLLLAAAGGALVLLAGAAHAELARLSIATLLTLGFGAAGLHHVRQEFGPNAKRRAAPPG